MAIGAHLDGNDPAEVNYGLAFVQFPVGTAMKLPFPFGLGAELTDTLHNDMFGASPIRAHQLDEQAFGISVGTATSQDWEATRKRLFPGMH